MRLKTNITGHQPAEDYIYQIDCAPGLQLSETLSAISSKSSDAGWAAGVPDDPAFTNQVAQVRVPPMVEGTHRATFLITTSLGNLVELDVDVDVVET